MIQEFTKTIKFHLECSGCGQRPGHCHSVSDDLEASFCLWNVLQWTLKLNPSWDLIWAFFFFAFSAGVEHVQWGHTLSWQASSFSVWRRDERKRWNRNEVAFLLFFNSMLSVMSMLKVFLQAGYWVQLRTQPGVLCLKSKRIHSIFMDFIHHEIIVQQTADYFYAWHIVLQAKCSKQVLWGLMWTFLEEFSLLQ